MSLIYPSQQRHKFGFRRESIPSALSSTALCPQMGNPNRKYLECPPGGKGDEGIGFAGRATVVGESSAEASQH